jgi:hypothetical protein
VPLPPATSRRSVEFLQLALLLQSVDASRATDGKLRMSDETEAFRWATEADIRELVSEAYAVRVIDALHDRSPAAIRKHDGRTLV